MAVTTHQSTALRFGMFACFTATTLVFSPNTSIFSGMAMGGENLGFFVFPMFIAACLGAGVLVVFLRTHSVDEYRSLSLLVAAALVHLASVAIFVAGNYGAALPSAVFALAGTLYGLSLVVLCSAWASILGNVTFRKAILCVTLVCLGSYALSAVLGLLPAAWRWIPYLVLFCAGTVAPCVFAPRNLPDAKATGAAGAAGEAGAAGTAGVTGAAGETTPDNDGEQDTNTADLIRALRLPGIGMLLFAFLMALNKTRVFDVVECEYVAGFIAAFCFLVVIAVRREVLLPSFLYRVVAPTIGGVVVVLLALSGQVEVNDVAFIAVYVFLSALGILAFANVLAIINAGEFSAEFVASVGMLAGFGVSLIGIAWSRFSGGPGNVSAVVFVLIAIYCACMMVYLGWESWRMMNRPEKEREVVESASQDWQARAEAAKLSKREIEILSYLGRGHSTIYIAEQLFISESTVRTHTKHIYAKLGIHSREELFAFIDGE